jgi:hypothetical protein
VHQEEYHFKSLDESQIAGVTNQEISGETQRGSSERDLVELQTVQCFSSRFGIEHGE